MIAGRRDRFRKQHDVGEPRPGSGCPQAVDLRGCPSGRRGENHLAGWRARSVAGRFVQDLAQDGGDQLDRGDGHLTELDPLGRFQRL